MLSSILLKKKRFRILAISLFVSLVKSIWFGLLFYLYSSRYWLSSWFQVYQFHSTCAPGSLGLRQKNFWNSFPRPQVTFKRWYGKESEYRKLYSKLLGRRIREIMFLLITFLFLLLLIYYVLNLYWYTLQNMFLFLGKVAQTRLCNNSKGDP